MRKYFTIITTCLLIGFSAFAQDVTISGTLTDQQSGDALIGANVLIKGT